MDRSKWKWVVGITVVILLFYWMFGCADTVYRVVAPVVQDELCEAGFPPGQCKDKHDKETDDDSAGGE